MDIRQQAQRSAVQAVDEAVAYWFGMRVEELHAIRNGRVCAVPRQIAIYLMNQMMGASLTEISIHFGGMHESTIRRAISKVKSLRRNVSAAELTVRGLMENLGMVVREGTHSAAPGDRRVLFMTRLPTAAREVKLGLATPVMLQSNPVPQSHAQRRFPVFPNSQSRREFTWSQGLRT